MTEFDDDVQLLEIDRLIDEIVSQRVDDEGIPERGPSLVKWGEVTDGDLVSRLNALGPIEWPADEVGDRIVLAVRVRSGAVELGGPTDPVHRHQVYRRTIRPRYWASAVVGVAALALIAFLATTPADTGPSGRNPGNSVATQVTSRTMRLVDSTTSPFQAVGAGPQTGNLECVTMLVCYADETSGSPVEGSGVERTSDGGATWRPTSALPNHALLSWPLSCPTTKVCFGVVSQRFSHTSATDQPQLAVTSDGGVRWRIESLAVPAGFEGATIDEVSCAAARECVIHIWGNGEGTFLFTDNGGLTWSTASIVPPAASGTLWALRCDPNGSCIGLIPTGSVQHPSTEGITSLRTSDGGRTWTASSANLAVGPGTLLISCGDAMHCLAAYSSVTSATIAIATTSNGGGGWRVTAPPPSWPNTAISVSCATGLNCFVSAASATDNGYNHPVIAATHDGGITWVPLTLPDLPGSQLALVFPLSCPIGDGCVGVGATELEFAPPTTMPASGSVPDIGQRVIVSNLVASTG